MCAQVEDTPGEHLSLRSVSAAASFPTLELLLSNLLAECAILGGTLFPRYP